MSKVSPTTNSDSSIQTGVTHEGAEVAVRARSKYSRSAHEPITDHEGNVVFFAPAEPSEPGRCKIVDEGHEDAEPRPKCGLPTGDVCGVDFRLSTCSNVSNRPACGYCTGTNGDPAKGSGNKSAARILRYGEDWGEGSA